MVRSLSAAVTRSAPSSGPVTSVSHCGIGTGGCTGARSWEERYSGESSGG